MTVHAPGIPHPRIAERRANVSAAALSKERRRRRTLWTALGVSLLLLSGYLTTRSELLDVDRVAVAGAGRTADADILAAAAVGHGQPLVGLDLAAARARIAELPWVEEVYSARSWDGTVRFDVSERRPVAAVAIPGAWATVDARGRVLTVAGDLADPVVPIVGLNIIGAAPGDWLDATHRDAVGVAAALGEPVRSAVRAVAVTPVGHVLEMHIPGRILLGSSNDLEAKLLAVTTFLERVNLHCMELLDVRAATTPVLTRGSSCR